MIAQCNKHKSQKISDNRIDWIDSARGIGLLLVIIGHLNFPYLENWIYSFHMPLFFFISGMLYPGCKQYTLLQFVRRRFKSLVIPYFTLGGIIVLFRYSLCAFSNAEPSAYIEILRSFLIQKSYWAIWFLAALFLTQILYLFIDYFFHKTKYATSLASLAICSFGLIRYRLGWGSLPWNLDVAFVAQLFFHFGCQFMQSQRIVDFFTGPSSIARRIIVVLFCALIHVVTVSACVFLSGETMRMSRGIYGNEVLTIIGAFFGIFMIVTLAPILQSNSLIVYLGRNSMVLFSLHRNIIIEVCDIIYVYFGLFQSGDYVSDYARAFVSFIIVIAVLVPFNEFLKKLPCHKIFGV